MEWKQLSKADAKAITAQWNSLSAEEFENVRKNWQSELDGELSDSYAELRKSLLTAWNFTVTSVRKDQSHQKLEKYMVDIRFGRALYSELARRGFSQRLASFDGVWIYLCIKVVPDIIVSRFKEKGSSQNVNEARFWKTSRRIYLKTLWWYIHLSLQDGPDLKSRLSNTVEMLKDHTTDTVVQLVERSGKSGYRPEVYREIMKYYSNLEASPRVKTALFRKVMVLNTARTVTVEPELCQGGVKAYVKELYGYFGY